MNTAIRKLRSAKRAQQQKPSRRHPSFHRANLRYLKVKNGKAVEAPQEVLAMES